MKVIILAFVVGALAGLAVADFADSSTEKQAISASMPVMQKAVHTPESTCYYTRPSEHDRTYTLAILPGVTCVTILK